MFSGYTALLKARQRKAFHPMTPFEIVSVHRSVFCVIRYVKDGTSPSCLLEVLCANDLIEPNETMVLLHNVSAAPIELEASSFPSTLEGTEWINVQGGNQLQLSSLALAPYEILWLRRASA